MCQCTKKGFSLIELLIVVAIIGILAGISYPSYRDHVIRTRRSEAQAALIDLSARMERYFSQNNTYVGATIGAGNPATDVLDSALTVDGWYLVNIIAQSNSAFSVQATPQKTQVEDTKCASLTLNSVGLKGTTGGGTVQDCW